MEILIEDTIDKGLDSISSGLYVFSIAIGVLLFISGIIFLATNKGPDRKKGYATGGWICIIIGIIAIASGAMQM